MAQQATIPAMPTGDADDTVVRFCAWLIAAGRTPGTVAQRGKHLRAASRHIDLPTATTGQLVAYLAAQHWARNTRRSVHESLSGYYRWAQRAGLRSDQPMDMLPIPRRVPPHPHPATDAALARARAAASPDELLMIDLGCCAGMRRAEIAAARREHLIPGPALRVPGKGGRERAVPIPAPLAARIAERPPGWLFPSPRIPGRPVTPGCVGERLSLLLGPDCSAHALRHRFATRAYYLGGRDLAAVQRLMGHADPNTTLAYIDLDLDTLRPVALAAAS